MKKRYIIIALSIYYILNVLNTYFLTTQPLNKYFSSFERDFLSEFSSILGNVAILTLLLIPLFSLVKKGYKRVFGMGIITLILGILIFALKIYTKYYGTVFSFQTLSVFKNPAANLGLSIVLEAIKEFFVGLGFIQILPGIILIGYSIYLKRIEYSFNFESRHLSLIFKTTLTLMMLLISFTSFYIFSRIAETKWPYESDITGFGVQYAGVYNFYLYDILGLQLEEDTKEETKDFVKENLSAFNYNGTHINILDGKEYQSPFDDKYSIFKDKNLYVLHLESVNNFLIGLKVNGIEITPNLNKIVNMENVYYFQNYYTTSGQGVSADAELSVMTGITPNGSSTFHWDCENTNYIMDSLPALFKEKYTSSNVESYHGDIREFYNREQVHEDVFGFDKYYSVENYNETHPDSGSDKYISGWVSDEEMVNWVEERIENTNGKYFYYNIFTVSHTPFLHNPIEGTLDLGLDSEILTRYLEFMHYVDDIMGKFIESKKNDLDTVFYVYGDHGCGINDGSLKEIMPEKSDIEIKEELRKTVAFIYNPSGELEEFMDGNMTQPLLRGHVDAFTTLCSLWGLKPKYYTFGVNGLSNEPTFNYNPINFTVYTDNYIYPVKRPNEAKIYNYSYDKTKTEIEKIELFKKCIDAVIEYNMFSEFVA